MKDFDEIAAAREIVEILCSGFRVRRIANLRARGLAEALEELPPKKLQLMLSLMREEEADNKGEER